MLFKFVTADLFSFAAILFAFSVFAGDKKKVSIPLRVSFWEEGDALRWIEIKRSAFFLLAKSVRFESLINLSLSRVR